MINRHFGMPAQNNIINKCFKTSCFTPAVFSIFVVLFLLWILIEVSYLILEKPEPILFLWNSQLSRNVSSYIRPEKDTTILNPSTKCSSSINILFAVPSAVNNTLQRDAIRKTWGTWIKNENSHFGINNTSVDQMTKLDMKLVFILGKDKAWHKGKVGAKIMREYTRYRDVIVEDFIDSYLNLTLKSIFLLKWVDKNCPQVKFVMKVDDDMFVNVPNLVLALNEPKLNNPLLMGCLICNARPIKNPQSKWYSPGYMFSGKYPNYLSGTSYILSGSIVKKLLNAAVHTPYFHLEDVFITGICAKKIGIRPINHKGFSYFKRAFNPCVYKDIISGHEVTQEEMKKLWNMLHNFTMIRKCKAISEKVLFPHTPGKCLWS